MNDYIKELSNKLNLVEHSQDWGYCNSDPHRINDFVNFYTSNPSLHKIEKFELARLILESMNDAIIENIVKDYEINFFKEFLIKYHHEFPDAIYDFETLDYNDSPISKLLIEFGIESSNNSIF